MIEKLIASVLTALFLFAAIGTLTGCNTVEGAGKDIEQGAKALRDEARELRGRM